MTLRFTNRLLLTTHIQTTSRFEYLRQFTPRTQHQVRQVKHQVTPRAQGQEKRQFMLSHTKRNANLCQVTPRAQRQEKRQFMPSAQHQEKYQELNAKRNANLCQVTPRETPIYAKLHQELNTNRNDNLRQEPNTILRQEFNDKYQLEPTGLTRLLHRPITRHDVTQPLPDSLPKGSYHCPPHYRSIYLSGKPTNTSE